MSQYQELYKAVERRYKNEWSAKRIQEHTNEKWQKMKKDKQNFPRNVEEIIEKLNINSISKRASLLNFFVKVSTYEFSIQSIYISFLVVCLFEGKHSKRASVSGSLRNYNG